MLLNGWLHWTKFFAASAMVAALAALAIPGPAGDVTGAASVLAVGAIALFAEHAWGLLVIGVAEVMLLGKLWPPLAFGDPSQPGVVAATIAFVIALPGLVLFAATLPRTVEVLLGDQPERTHTVAIALSSTAAIAWLLVPML